MKEYERICQRPLRSSTHAISDPKAGCDLDRGEARQRLAGGFHEHPHAVQGAEIRMDHMGTTAEQIR